MNTYNHSALVCPVCAAPLSSNEKTYACPNNHSFDKAKQGYVNLLLVNQKSRAEPGDNKEMVQNRLAFLKQGYYQTITHKINHAVSKILESHTKSHLEIADIGCGVGYYLCSLKNHIDSMERSATYYGIDISKAAIHCASQNDKTITFIVGTANNLPFAPQSIDVVLSVFSPIYLETLQRVLSPDGFAMIVTPGKYHLLELRSMLFDEVREINPDKFIEKSKGILELVDSVPIQATIQLQSSTDIENLLKMTPFYFRSSASKKQQLLLLENLSVTIDVTLGIYKKINSSPVTLDI